MSIADVEVEHGMGLLNSLYADTDEGRLVWQVSPFGDQFVALHPSMAHAAYVIDEHGLATTDTEGRILEDQVLKGDEPSTQSEFQNLWQLVQKTAIPWTE